MGLERSDDIMESPDILQDDAVQAQPGIDNADGLVRNDIFVQGMSAFDTLEQRCVQFDQLLLKDIAVHATMTLHSSGGELFRQQIEYALLRSVCMDQQNAACFFQLCSTLIRNTVSAESLPEFSQRVLEWIAAIDLARPEFSSLSAYDLEVVHQHILLVSRQYFGTDEHVVDGPMREGELRQYLRRFEAICFVDDDQQLRVRDDQLELQAVQSPLWRVYHCWLQIRRTLRGQMSEEDKVQTLQTWLHEPSNWSYLPQTSAELQQVSVFAQLANAGRTEAVSPQALEEMSTQLNLLLVDAYLRHDEAVVAMDIPDAYSSSISKGWNFYAHDALRLVAAHLGQSSELYQTLLYRLILDHEQDFIAALSHYLNFHGFMERENYAETVHSVLGALHAAIGSQSLKQLFLRVWGFDDPIAPPTLEASKLISDSLVDAFEALQLPYLTAYILAGSNHLGLYNAIISPNTPPEKFEGLLGLMCEENPRLVPFLEKHPHLFRHVLLGMLDSDLYGEFFWDHLAVTRSCESYAEQSVNHESRRYQLLSELSFSLVSRVRTGLAAHTDEALKSLCTSLLSHYPDDLAVLQRMIVMHVRNSEMTSEESEDLLGQVALHVRSILLEFDVSFDDIARYAHSSEALPDEWSDLMPYLEEEGSDHINVLSQWLQNYSADDYQNLEYPEFTSIFEIHALVRYFTQFGISSAKFEFFHERAIQSYIECSSRTPQEKMYEFALLVIDDRSRMDAGDKPMTPFYERLRDALINRFPQECEYVLFELFNVATTFEDPQRQRATLFFIVQQMQCIFNDKPEFIQMNLIKPISSIVDYDLRGNIVFAHDSDSDRVVAFLSLTIDVFQELGLEGFRRELFSILVLHRECAQFGELHIHDTRSEQDDALRPHCAYLSSQFPHFQADERRLAVQARNALRILEPRGKALYEDEVQRRIARYQSKQYPPFECTPEELQSCDDSFDREYYSALDAFAGIYLYVADSNIRDNMSAVFESTRLILGHKINYLARRQTGIDYHMIRVFALYVREACQGNADLLSELQSVFTFIDEQYGSSGDETYTAYFTRLVGEGNDYLPEDVHDDHTYFHSVISEHNEALNVNTLGTVSANVLMMHTVMLTTLFVEASSSVEATLGLLLNCLLEGGSNWRVKTFHDLYSLYLAASHSLTTVNLYRNAKEWNPIPLPRVIGLLAPFFSEGCIQMVDQEQGMTFGHMSLLFLMTDFAGDDLAMSPAEFRDGFHTVAIAHFAERFPDDFDRLFSRYIQRTATEGYLERMRHACMAYVESVSPDRFVALCEAHFLVPECSTFHPHSAHGNDTLNALIGYVSTNKQLESLSHSIIQHITRQQLSST